MSVIYHCDLASCGKRRRGTYNADAKDWVMPPGWCDFPLDNYVAHACSEAHYQELKSAHELGEPQTPVTGQPRGMKL